MKFLSHWTLAVLALLSFSCAKRIEVRTDPSVIHVAGENCLLGNVVISDAQGKIRCVDYTPALNHGENCNSWAAPMHSTVINAMFQHKDIPVVSRFDKFLNTANVAPTAGHEGDVMLTTGSVGIGLNVPAKVEVGVKMQALDLLVGLKAAYLALQSTQDKCLRAQTKTDLDEIGISTGEQIIGYVSRAQLGFAHYLNLVSVEITGKEPTGIVKLKADSFTISTKVQGRIENSYKEALKALLQEIDGKTAAAVSSELAGGVEKVTILVTIAVTVSKFPKLNSNQ